MRLTYDGFIEACKLYIYFLLVFAASFGLLWVVMQWGAMAIILIASVVLFVALWILKS